MSNKKYTPVIGLEIHVELSTNSKMFCGCKNDPFGADAPNSHVCPVCLGMPGALPVPNRIAIESTVLLGLALGCSINRYSKFDRKHYRYPDLPKGYQITQYELPFCYGSKLMTSEGPVRLRRIHLEEDTAKLLHHSSTAQLTTWHGAKSKGEESRIDFNRSGVPLMELVTEPDIHCAAQAKEFGKRLRAIIVYLGISDADLERGNMRLEASVSLRKEGDTALPPYKVELKNINSFSFMEKAIQFEIKRQTALLEQGIQPAQETRGWHEATGETVLQRSKENADDYRYFPDPDIPPIELSEELLNELKAVIPELPGAKVERWKKDYGIEERYGVLLSDDREEAEKWNTLFSALKKESVHVADFVKDVANKKTAFTNQTPVADIQEHYHAKKTADAPSPEKITEAVAAVIAENAKAVADFRGGSEKAVMFLLGMVFKKLRTKLGADSIREELLNTLKKK
ncbi:MAG: Asp-tRNA(Asn)/Glu-tRNA(Gln) amidotransferase subunit GatB [Patescibacteria group bacterium]